MDSAHWSSEFQAYTDYSDPTNGQIEQGTEKETVNGSWSADGGGTLTDHLEGYDPQGNMYGKEYIDDTLDSNCGIALQHVSTMDPNTPDTYSTNSGWITITVETGGLSYPPSGSTLVQKHDSQVKMSFHVGGFATAGLQLLVQAAANFGAEVLEQAPGTRNLPFPDLTVDGLGENLGTDGSAFGLSSPGETVGMNLSAGVPDLQFFDGGGTLVPTIYANGMDLSTNEPQCYVGQKVKLTCGWENGGTISISNFSWSIAGNAISNFYISPDSFITNGYPVSEFIKTNSEADFYWVDDGDKQVSCTFKANGQTLTAKGLIHAIKPTGTILALITGQPSIYGSDFIFGGGSLAGIEFFKRDYNSNIGEWRLVQLGTQQFNYLNATNNLWYVKQGSGLDTSFPYPVDETDSPSTPLDSNYSEITGSGNFTMYMLFKPSGDDSIYVPIRKINWNWSGTAINSNGVWTASGPGGHVDGGDSAASSMISWQDNIARTLNVLVPAP